MKDVERGGDTSSDTPLGSASPSNSTQAKRSSARLFGLPLGEYSPSSQVLICSLGTFGFYLLNGYAHERIFHYEGFKFGWFLTGVQFLVYTILSGSELAITSKANGSGTPWRDYVLIAFIMVFTMGLSNASLSYLSYPIMQLFKSCKLIPVMIGGRFINNRSYSYLEVFSAFFLTAGLGVLALESYSSETVTAMTINLIGVTMISSALVADGFFGNMQERALHTLGVSQNELVFHTHLIGVLFVGIVVTAIGEIGPALAYVFSDNWSVILWILVFAGAGYIGVAFVLTLIELFGSFVAMTVTSCRKVLSITLSFVFFPKPLSSHFLAAAVLIFTGLYLHIYSKNSKEMLAYFLRCFAWLKPRRFTEDQRFFSS